MNDVAWLPIVYRGFYDAPRLVVTEFASTSYLFDCPFDHDADEYPGHYLVYRLPGRFAEYHALASWEDLATTGEFIGRVPAAAIQFDQSKRKSVDDRVFDLLQVNS